MAFTLMSLLWNLVTGPGDQADITSNGPLDMQTDPITLQKQIIKKRKP